MLLIIPAMLRMPLPHPLQEGSGPQMSQVGRAGNPGIAEGWFCRGDGTMWKEHRPAHPKPPSWHPSPLRLRAPTPESQHWVQTQLQLLPAVGTGASS